MKRNIIIIMVVLIGLPVIFPICISILGGLSPVLSFLLDNSNFSVVLLILMILAILGLCLYIIKRNYSPLSSDSKSSFWQILTNIFLVFFTFWMGIFVQDIIASKNESVSNKMITFEYIDRIHPDYKDIAYNDMYSRFAVYAGIKKQFSEKLLNDSTMLRDDYSYADSCKHDSQILNRCEKSMAKYILNNRDEIIRQSRKHDSIMAEYKYYLNQEMFDSISKINQKRNIWLAIFDLLDDSTKLNNNQYSALVESYGYNDTLQLSKEIAYFENAFTTRYAMHSGIPLESYGFLTTEACDLYHNIKDASKLSSDLSILEDSLFLLFDSLLSSIPEKRNIVDSLKNNGLGIENYNHVHFAEFKLLKELVEYLVLDGMIMTNEMQLLRASSRNPFEKWLSPVLNPVTIFIIFLLLTFIVSAIIVKIISPRKVKPFVSKEDYDRLKKEYNDLLIVKQQKEIELNRKREECKSSDKLNKELSRTIVEKDKKIADLERIIHD